MNEETKPRAHGEFERQDLSAPLVLGSLTGLAVLGVVVYGIVLGVYWYLDRQSEIHQPPQNPLVTARPLDSRTATPAQFKAEIKSTFPEPRLEEDERRQLNAVRLEEERRLDSYGWVDEKAGTIHIPIERAMQLVAQQGLPVQPAETPPAGKKLNTTLGKKNRATK